jgi:uncharacterized membrane protein YciS (DUF1049 family)
MIFFFKLELSKMPSEKKIKTQKQKQKEEGGRATPFGQKNK